MTTLYRAAKETYMERGTASFSADRSVAEAYTDNPSFGGSTIYTVDADLSDMLDLVDGDMPRWLERHVEKMGAIELAQAITAPWAKTYTMLAERGYRWVRFADDFPEGAVTIARVVLGDDSDDDLMDAMSEA